MCEHDIRIQPSELTRTGDQPTELERAEFEQIQRRRFKSLTGQDPPDGLSELDVDQQHERNLLGLAFSGGGIRSATFALGVLQGLADLNVLKFVDYLSTVSGGGYIGSWFAAWVKREGSLDNVVQQLKPQRTDQSKANRGFADDEPPNTTGQVAEKEPEAINHLRQYSNYLSPKLGIFSSDSWTLVAVYLRNLVSNLLVIIPAIIGIILVARGLARALTIQGYQPAGLVVGAASLCLLLRTFTLIFRSVVQVNSEPSSEPESAAARSKQAARFKWICGLLGVNAILLTWLMVPFTTLTNQGKPLEETDWIARFSWGLNIANGSGFDLEGSGYSPDSWPFWLFGKFPIVQFVLGIGLLHGLAPLLGIGNSTSRISIFERVWRGFLSGACGGMLLYLVLDQVMWRCAGHPAAVVVLGPPLILLVFNLGVILEVALLGILADETEREWWNKLIAWGLILSAGWLVVTGVALFGDIALQGLGGWAKTGLAAGWVTTALGGLWAARSAKTKGEQQDSVAELVSSVAPYAFLLGLMCLLSSLTTVLITMKDDELASHIKHQQDRFPLKAEPDLSDRVTEVTDKSTFDPPQTKTKDQTIHQRRITWRRDDWGIRKMTQWFILSNSPWGRLGVLFGACFALVWVLSWCVDINEFSLNAMYANRLTRCYLGASRRKRGPTPRPAGTGATNDAWGMARGTPGRSHGRLWSPDVITGFDPADDLKLAALQTGYPKTTSVTLTHEQQTERQQQLCHSKRAMKNDQLPYWGPYPLINTALNLVAGDELAWQERMAESFVLSPLFCGSHSLGYRSTCDYASGLTLGRAVAISGAAANPNMGYHSSFATTAMLTLFNVRLGWWLPNPKTNDNTTWKRSSPSFLLKWLAVNTVRHDD